jgi:type II secretory pathway pseudopilin PulG
MFAPRNNARGQATLIGLLVAILIIGVLAAIYYPRVAARHSAPDEPRTPVERASGANCDLYVSQINQALAMYKDANDDRSPRTLNDLKPYGITDDIINAPGCTFREDPATGQVRDYGGGKAAYPTVNPDGSLNSGGQSGSPQPQQSAPGGISIPTIPDGT